MSIDYRLLLLDMFQAAVNAAAPALCVPAHLPPRPTVRTIIVGAGKAAASMAATVEAHWNGPLEGLVVTRYGHRVPCKYVEVVEASHPVPDEAGSKAARGILDKVSGLTADDLVLVLISGGGSALLALPAGHISLADKQAINRALLKCGAHIAEMNTVRKHLSAIKGGRLAVAAAPARVGHARDFRCARRRSLHYCVRSHRAGRIHARRRAGRNDKIWHRDSGHRCDAPECRRLGDTEAGRSALCKCRKQSRGDTTEIPGGCGQGRARCRVTLRDPWQCDRGRGPRRRHRSCWHCAAMRRLGPAARNPLGENVVIITGAGGSGVLLSDACIDNKLSLMTIPPDLDAAFRKFIPPFGAAGNPVDITGGEPPITYV